MAFKDLDDFLDEPPFVLPIRGKRYEFPGDISAESWLRLHRLTMRALAGDGDLSDVVISDVEEAALMDEMFGAAKAEMLTDGCSGAELKLVWMTLISFHTQGRAIAELVWNTRGEAPTPSREVRRSSAPKTSTRSRGSLGGSTPRPKRKAAPSGQTSSATGTQSRPT